MHFGRHVASFCSTLNWTWQETDPKMSKNVCTAVWLLIVILPPTKNLFLSFFDYGDHLLTCVKFKMERNLGVRMYCANILSILHCCLFLCMQWSQKQQVDDNSIQHFLHLENPEEAVCKTCDTTATCIILFVCRCLPEDRPCRETWRELQ